jgi:O-antigen/teichoic acid export membrane protein
MSNTGKTIIKNTSVMMGAQAASWIFMFGLMIFLPRYLGAEAYGAIGLGTSIWTVVGVAMAFGMDVFLVKEVARHPEKTSELMGTTLLLRGLLFGLGLAAVALYLHLVDYPPLTVQVVYLMGITHLLWLFINGCHAVLQGLEVMEYISIANITGKAVHTGVAITALLLGYGIYTIVGISMLAALVVLVMQLTFLSWRHPPRFRLNPAQGKELLRASTPYLMIALVASIYMEADIVIISLLMDETAVGWYASARRLTGTFMFFPVVFIGAIFPALSRIYTQDAERLPLLVRKSFDLMVLMSIPIGLGLAILAQPLVILLFGAEFAPAGPILSVMGIMLIFIYMNTLMGKFLISTDRQNNWTVVMIVATIVSIGLDLLLIPWCSRVLGNGAIGGALSFLVTEIGMVIVGITLLPKGTMGWSNLRFFLLALLAGLGMVGVVWWWRDAFIAIPILLGAVTYLSLIALLRVVPAEDVALARNLGAQMINRIRRRRTKPVNAGETVSIEGAYAGND